METIWWNQITSARNFIEQIIYSLCSSKNVVLTLPYWVPWYKTFCSIIDTELCKRSPEYKLEFLYCPEQEPGKYLFDNYCQKDKRAHYRPIEPFSHFLAKNEDISLNHRYLWIKDIPEKRFPEWIKFVSEYKRASSCSASASFILEKKNGTLNRKEGKVFIQFDLSDWIDPYDCYTFCALAGSKINIPSCYRPYLAEVLSCVCGRDAEFCAACLKEWDTFLDNPVGVLQEIQNRERKETGTSFFLDPQKDSIYSKLWQAQLKQLFPVIEQYRFGFIQQHSEQLAEASDNQNTDAQSDMELRDLCKLYHNGTLKLPREEYTELDFFRKSRNSLAHLTPLPSKEVRHILNACQENENGFR